MGIPGLHPRRKSLLQRERLVKGVRAGITSLNGLIAFGRGEALDYLLGEKTTGWARRAARAAAALLVLAKHPVISVNGNTAALCPREIAALAKTVGAKIEVNLFHRTRAREKAIAGVFSRLGVRILGLRKDARIPGLASERAKVSKEGIFSADVVLVPLEDGDRTQALRRMGKKVIAIDLNPLSRTARAAHITIVDNVVRAVPNITGFARALKSRPRSALGRTASLFDNRKNLLESEKVMRRAL
ncbi:MAG: 4-phosphopantoate--beta-alanine ligase [Candidatus Micrarchaeia archaeon]